MDTRVQSILIYSIILSKRKSRQVNFYLYISSDEDNIVDLLKLLLRDTTKKFTRDLELWKLSEVGE